MADTILIKAGNGDVPTLKDRELAYRKDTRALYVGTGDQNVKVGDANWEDRIQALESKIASIEGLINTINERLDALQT
jgi:hypothetical protein